MVDRIRPAAIDELQAVYQFYAEVCAAQASDEYGPGWHIDLYPSREDLREYMEKQELLLGFSGDRIASALVLTGREDELYADVAWAVPAADDEVSVLHLFAVHPDFRGKGVSTAMIGAMLETAAKQGKKAIHLDVVKGNLPAEKLYRKMGFRFACELPVWYVDTGDIVVRLYEYDLSQYSR